MTKPRDHAAFVDAMQKTDRERLKDSPVDYVLEAMGVKPGEMIALPDGTVLQRGPDGNPNDLKETRESEIQRIRHSNKSVTEFITGIKCAPAFIQIEEITDQLPEEVWTVQPTPTFNGAYIEFSPTERHPAIDAEDLGAELVNTERVERLKASMSGTITGRGTLKWTKVGRRFFRAIWGSGVKRPPVRHWPAARRRRARRAEK